MQKHTVYAPEPVASVVTKPVNYNRLNRGVAALGTLSTDNTSSNNSIQRKNPMETEAVLGVVAVAAIIGLGLWWSLPQRQMQQEYADTLRAYRRKIAESKGGEVPPMPAPPTNINISQYGGGGGFYN